MNNTLDAIWAAQVAYNSRLRQREQPGNYEYWMKQYLLGAVSEVDEILDEINWKIHRRNHSTDKNNLARELADLTKYVLSMWEWSGFDLRDLLRTVQDKNLELEDQWHQDFEVAVEADAMVVITDLDGTVGDYRKAFYTWLLRYHRDELPVDKGEHLYMEMDLGLPYTTYVTLKEQFEAEGGYATLQAYPDAGDLLRELSMRKVHIAAYTARPAQRYSRIWHDTWSWLTLEGLSHYIKELRIGQEARIARACELVEQGHKVLMLEDDPTTALRAAQAGIWVVLRDQPYNVGVAHSHIYRVEKFDVETIFNVYLKEQPNGHRVY